MVLLWNCEMKLYNRHNDSSEDKLEAIPDGRRTVYSEQQGR
jgi:hypothetical protein